MRELIESPLDQAYTHNDKSVLIEIYRKPDTDWTVQVVTFLATRRFGVKGSQLIPTL